MIYKGISACMILPDSRNKISWNFLMIIVVLYTVTADIYFTGFYMNNDLIA